MSTTPGPATDDDVPAYLAAIGLAGLVDIHVHFLPEPMLRNVGAFFDEADVRYGVPWPIPDAVRCATMYPEPGVGD
ncbi:hypothetical protein GCM10010429_36700 [Micromonospora olivasterospora]|uniref:Amidohydrolase n=1 Tax=Micromonospora olivasterospora TaxID=1880 RepID=A0A562I3H6_MICOL|nr:hypothetical protein JD77_00108 [Micromonospora olivasterospora]